MHIDIVPLVLIVMAVFLLALGQDPAKKHGIFAAVLVALAVVTVFAAEPAMLARLGR